jgi:hypothetical protein
MTEDELRRHFTSNTYGLAIICGRVSGHLLTLDFDNDDGLATRRFNAWSEAVLSGKPHLYTKLVITTSPSGGYHVRLRCTEPVGGNDKLAKSKDGQTTLIETRGEGGYAVAPPTPGYELTQGTLTNPPTISADDRAYLIATARQFNQVEHKAKVQHPAKLRMVRPDGEQKAGDLYNQTDEYRELLTRHKWTLEKAFETQERWLRPGSDSDSSATFHTDTRLFNVFTPNAEPLEGGGSYDPFGLLAMLDYDGDHTAASRQLYTEHPEWQIPSNGYKPSRPEQAAGEAQLERMAGLHTETPKGLEMPADSRDVGLIPDRLDMPIIGSDIRHKTDAVEQMRQAMQDTDTSIVELMKWTPGSGKTHEAEAVAAEKAELGQATIFAMQSNERAEQEAAAMLERFGYQAAVIKGRNDDNCTQYKLAEALGKGGHSVRQSLCLHCPGRQECIASGYLGQFDGYQSGKTKVAFMPAESAVELLKDNKGNATLSADVLVFDEDPSRIALMEHSLTVKQLDNINTSTEPIGAVVDLLSELVLSLRDDGQALNDWSPLKNRIQSILKRFKRKGGYHADLAMDTERVLREVVGQINDTSRNLISPSPEYVEQVEPRWLADIVSELKRTISADEPINVSLVVTAERLVFRHPRTIRPQAKMVVLDAYGRPELYRQVFKREVRVHQHQLEPDMKLWHVPMNTSRASLKDDRPGRWTPTKWQQVVRNLTSLFEFEKMVVFVDGKETVTKVETAVESLGLSHKVAVDYFYRGRGSNKYQDYDAAVVLGSAWPRSDAMVSETRALHRDGRYISDEVKSTNRRQFRDSRLQQFNQSKQIDEIVQSVYRIRPATHQHRLGKKVVICTGFEVEGLTDQAEVIRLDSRSIEAEIRRTNLADSVSEYLSKYSCMTLAPGLNSKLAEMLPGRQAGRRFAEFAYNNNTEDNSLISSHCETSHSKGFSVSARTLEDDMDKLAKNGLVDKHRATVVLDGQTYPSVVYGSLDAFKADIEQARAVLAAEIATMAQGERTDVEPSPKLGKVSHAEAAEIANLDLGANQHTEGRKNYRPSTQAEAAEKLDVSDKYVREAKKIQRESPEHFDKVKSGELSLQQADPEVEPLPFSRDVADKLEHYCISRDQWRKETLGGELAAVRFSELIDQVDGEARQAVLKIPAPEIFSANLALKQVLSNRPSGLEMLGRWSA